MSNGRDRETPGRFLTAQVLRGSAWVGGLSVFRLILRIGSVAILARLVAPDQFGIAVGALLLVEFAMMFGYLGIPQAVIQREALTREHVANAASILFLYAVALCGLLLLAAPLFARVVNIEEVLDIAPWLAAIIGFRIFGALPEGLLARHDGAKKVGSINLLAWALASFGVAIPLGMAGAGFWAIIFGEVAEAVVKSLALFAFARERLVLPRLSRGPGTEILRLGLGYAIMAPVEFLNDSVDRFLIVRLFGTQGLGLYTRSRFLSVHSVTLVATITRLTAFPAMSRVQSDAARLRSAIRRGLALVALITLPIGVFAAVFAEEVITLLLGDQWGGAILPFAVFSLAFYPIIAQHVLGTFFDAIGRPYVLLPVRLAGAGLVATGVWALSGFGIVGACVGVASAATITAVISLWLTCRRAEIVPSEIVAVHMAPLALTLVVTAVAVGLKFMLADFHPALALSVAALVETVVAAVATVLCPQLFLGRAGLEILRSVFGDRLVLFGRRIVPAGEAGGQAS
ncbi:oligosaccharide flippase family protein [Tropicimonas marinistellae]|uniref:oligosaccharide flippase family protein n=1 Tax=Tropicimonas marinistellae TaxID=1739787 RepID=UPI00082F62AB|nr:oligosaccharide flippase family protein [Tropicimonas marinistellae]